MHSCQVISIDWAPERFSTYVLPRVFIRHQRPENSPLTTKNSLANVQLAYDYFLSRHGIFSCLQHYTFLLLLGFLVNTMPLTQKTPDRNNIFIFLNLPDIHYIHEQYFFHCTDLFICINIDYWVLTKVSLLIMMTSFAPWPCALSPFVNSVHPPLCIATAASFM